MNKITAWLWTFSFFANLGLCISGAEASWVVELTALGTLAICNWIYSLIDNI